MIVQGLDKIYYNFNIKLKFFENLVHPRWTEQGGKMMKAFIFPLLLFCSIELNTAAPISIKAYPNPATSFVFCTVQTPEAIDAPLIIYNWKGQEVKTVFGKQTPGVFTYFWSVNDMLSGIYFCRIQVENQIFIKKIIVLHPQ